MEDLIKRSDVWNITAILHSEFITIEQEQILERIDEMVDGLPPADRPQGEWFVYDDDDYLYTDIKCSACRTGFTVDAYRRMDIGFTIEDLKFCPNCGCKMRKE